MHYRPRGRRCIVTDVNCDITVRLTMENARKLRLDRGSGYRLQKDTPDPGLDYAGYTTLAAEAVAPDER